MDWLLNLKGPEFLQLYLGLIGLATAAGLFIRWRFRQPSDDAWIEGAPLDPYEVAYLKGGRVLAVNAALAGLVHRGELTVDAGNRKLRPVSAPGPEAYELERAVYQEAEAADGDVKELHKQDRELTDALPTRLIDEGLICADDTAERVRWGSVIPLAVVLVVGCLKIIVGMQRHRPVALLVILCVATGIMALAFLSKRPHRTRRGSRLLARLGRENAALHDTAITLRGRSGLKPKDVALAVGLYGAGVMANGSLSELKQLLKPPGGGGGCGSGCGSGCGGGGGCGGCGGGCGGCGG